MNELEEYCPYCGSEMNAMQTVVSTILVCTDLSCRFSIHKLSEEKVVQEKEVF